MFAGTRHEFSGGIVGWYASQLRHELGLRNRQLCLAACACRELRQPAGHRLRPDDGLHGNSSILHTPPLPPAPSGCAASTRSTHRRARSLPKPELDPARRWRELDSSMSSDALLDEHILRAGRSRVAADSQCPGHRRRCGPSFRLESPCAPHNGRFDRTEVDHAPWLAAR